MPITKNQPTLPAEIVASEAELNFIDESPPKVFPENQNSNWGLKRKNFTDQIQIAADQLDEMFSEHFVATSQSFLDEWEKQQGVPIAPTGWTLDKRRSILLGRVRYDPFTRTRRQQIIEAAISATFGGAAQFSSAGIVLDSSGVPLYSGASSLIGAYSIVEDIPNFTYTIYIQTSITPDMNALNRELSRITPSGISYTTQFVDEPLWPVNNVTNPSFETDTSGWTTYGTNTIARSTTRAKYGSASLLATYQNDLRLASAAVTATDKNRTYTGFAWIYIPSNWNGGQIQITDDGQFAGAGFINNVNANMALVDQWQRIFFTYTLADDNAGGIFIRAASAPTAGRQIYIDGVYLSPNGKNFLTNVVQGSNNAGFESFTAPWGGNFGTETFTRDTVTFHTGVASAKVITPGTAAGEGVFWGNDPPRYLQLVPGKFYRLSAWMNIPATKTIYLQISFLTVDGNQQGTAMLAPLAGNGAWQQVVISNIVPPANAWAAYILVITQTPQATTFYLDDVVFEEMPVYPTTPV